MCDITSGSQVFSLATVTDEDGPELKSKNKRNQESNGGGSLLKENVCLVEITPYRYLSEIIPSISASLAITLLPTTAPIGHGYLQVSEKGVDFRSYYNGQVISLTPESSVQAQKAYGSDIIIPLGKHQ